jgi:hypothetical protein
VTQPAPWITPEDVATFLDVPYPDDAGRIDGATFAAKAAIERRRSDLDFTDITTVPADVRQGGIRWAGLMFQSRNAPSGYPGYGDETAMFDALGSQRSEIMRLIGWRRPGLF